MKSLSVTNEQGAFQVGRYILFAGAQATLK